MSIDALLLHLETEAARESARLRQDAERSAAELLARAEADAARKRTLHLERVAERRRTSEEREVAAARARARASLFGARTEVIDHVFDTARTGLAALPASRYVSSLAALVRDAARYLEPGPAVLQSPPDAAAATAEALRGVPGFTVESVDGDAGVRGRSSDGRVTVDNTLVAILDRHRPDLAIALRDRIEAG